jgi:hypothetical protein
MSLVKTITGKMYIYPNPIINSIGIKDEIVIKRITFCNINSIEYSSEIWWVNIGISLDDDNFMINELPDYLPLLMLESVKEKDTVNFYIKYNNNDDLIQIKLKAEQTKSKYARFGLFENTLRHVIKIKN